MKNFLLTLALFSTGFLFAQDWESDTYKYDELYKGYIIDKEGNKTEGYIKYRNRYIMQNEIVFFKSKENLRSKETYAASDLYGYKVGDKEYECIPFSGGNKREVRANLVINNEGCIKEYIWYDRASGYNTFKLRPGETQKEFGDRKFPSTKVFYKDGDGIAVTKDFFKSDFAKTMREYIIANKALAKKVKSGTSGYNKMINIPAIFKEYNDGCPY